MIDFVVSPSHLGMRAAARSKRLTRVLFKVGMRGFRFCHSGLELRDYRKRQSTVPEVLPIGKRAGPRSWIEVGTGQEDATTENRLRGVIPRNEERMSFGDKLYN